MAIWISENILKCEIVFIAKILVLKSCVSVYVGLHAVPVRFDDINIKNADLLK